MSHVSVASLLPDYLSGALDRKSAESVEAHAEGCEECRAWLETASLLETALTCGHQATSSELAQFAGAPGSLELEEYRRIEAHLGVCEACCEDVELTRRALGQVDRRRSVWTGSERLIEQLSSHPAVAGAIAAGLLLAAIVTWFAISYAPSRSEEGVWQVLVQGEEVISAEGALLVEDVEVQGGGHLLVRTTHSVAFGDGFRVGPGGRLTVESGGSAVPAKR